MRRQLAVLVDNADVLEQVDDGKVFFSWFTVSEKVRCVGFGKMM